MSIVRDLSSLIRSCEHKEARTLILINKSPVVGYWTHFDFPYDHGPSEESIRALFDESMTKIKQFSEADSVVTDAELPIVRYIGRWKITLVIKSENGDITIQDGTRAPISGYMSVGG